MKISHINEVITLPELARNFIKQFMKDLGQDFDTGFIETTSRKIEFKNMSDEDAIFIANEFKSWTAEAAKRRLK